MKFIPWQIWQQADLDGFLNDTMARMNEMSKVRLTELEHQFLQTMVAAREIFDDDAFRKRYDKGRGRSPINKALFEAWSVNLRKLSEDQIMVLEREREVLKDKFIELMNTPEFSDAVSQGTGDARKVNLRFREIEQLIQEVLDDSSC